MINGQICSDMETPPHEGCINGFRCHRDFHPVSAGGFDRSHVINECSKIPRFEGGAMIGSWQCAIERKVFLKYLGTRCDGRKAYMEPHGVIAPPDRHPKCLSHGFHCPQIALSGQRRVISHAMEEGNFGSSAGASYSQRISDFT